MSRAWMPLYVGDYLRDTRNLTTLQHGAYLLLIMHYWEHNKLPEDETELAAIAGLPVKEWRKIAGPVAGKFLPGWRHKRIEDELVKADRAMAQRSTAARNGGIKSGISRAVKRGERLLDDEARSKRALRSNRSERLPENEAPSEAETNLPRTKHKEELITTSVLGAARASPDGPPQQPTNSAGSLATALCGGALTRQPSAEQDKEGAIRPKRVSDLSAQEIASAYAARRTGAAA